jgi:hypothetical protein
MPSVTNYNFWSKNDLIGWSAKRSNYYILCRV